MGKRPSVDTVAMREVINKLPWTVINTNWMTKEYRERVGGDPNKESIHYHLTRYGLEWAKESPNYDPLIEVAWTAAWGNRFVNMGPGVMKFVDHTVVREFIIDDPFLFMHPRLLREKYIKKTGHNVAPSTMQATTRKYGLLWAMESPDFDEDVIEAFRAHCKHRGRELPEEWRVGDSNP